MQPSGGKSSIRHVRLGRKSKSKILVEESTGWAVSYSDMLMVLLSFFIMFFSFDNEEQKQSLLSSITVDMVKQNSAKKKLDAGAGSTTSLTASARTESAGLHAKSGDVKTYLAKQFAGLKISTEQESGSENLLIHLTDNLYPSRGYNVNQNVRKELDKIFNTLRPYNQLVRIDIIGHSDKVPVTRRDQLLTSNTTLSSLRAAKALEYWTAKGFSAEYVTSSGAAQSQRDTRSLSLRIRPIK